MKQEKAFKAIFDIRNGELPLALLMFGYFFLVITSFWILKPIKKSLFIEFYDRLFKFKVIEIHEVKILNYRELVDFI